MPRILFIDAFGGSAKSRSAAKRSRAALRATVKGLAGDGGVCPLDFEVKSAHMSKLEKYTLGHPAGHEQVLREIDKLDVIVLDGDSSTLPWSPILDPLATLLRMCVTARKCILAAGRTANMLAFVLAHGPRGKPFTVVNGDGLGTPLNALDSFDAAEFPASSPENFVFLDSDTGDLYFPRGDRWLRQSSVGNTYGSSAPPSAKSLARANSSRARGQSATQRGSSGGSAGTSTVLQLQRGRPAPPPVHARAPIHRAVYTPFVGRSDEVLSQIRSECTNHYLFKGIDATAGFLTRRRKGVTVADFRIIRCCRRRARTLAGERGSTGPPVVFEYQNTVGCVFHIDPKYKAAPVVLRNFLVDKIQKIVAAGGHIDTRLHNTAAGVEAAAAASNRTSRLTAQARAHAEREGEQEGKAAHYFSSIGRAPSVRGQHWSPPPARPPISAKAAATRPTPAASQWEQSKVDVKRALRPFSARIARHETELRQAAERFEERVRSATSRRDRGGGGNDLGHGQRHRSGAQDHVEVQDQTQLIDEESDSDGSRELELLATGGRSRAESTDGEPQTHARKTRKPRTHTRVQRGTTQSSSTINSEGQVVVRSRQPKRAPSKSYLKWRRIDKSRGSQGNQNAFFSVVQGSPYESEFDQRMREEKEGRRNWVANQPFVTHSGKRSAMGKDDEFWSIHTGSDYNPPGNHQFRAHKPNKGKFAAGEWRFV